MSICTQKDVPAKHDASSSSYRNNDIGENLRDWIKQVLYICLTAHYFDKNWNLRRVLLDILLCTDRAYWRKSSSDTDMSLSDKTCLIQSRRFSSDWIKQVLSDNDISV